MGKLYSHGWWLPCGECTCSWTPALKGMICPSPQHPPLEMTLWLRGVLGLFSSLLWGAQRLCWPKYKETVHGAYAIAPTLQGQNLSSASPETARAIKLAHTLVNRTSRPWTMGVLHIRTPLGSQLAPCSSEWCYMHKVHGVTPPPSRKDRHIAQQSIPTSGIKIPRRSKPCLLLYRITECFTLEGTLKFI